MRVDLLSVSDLLAALGDMSGVVNHGVMGVEEMEELGVVYLDLPAVPVKIFEVLPGQRQASLDNPVIANGGVATAAVQTFVVPPGMAADSTTRVASAATLTPNAQFAPAGTIGLVEGWSLWASASVPGCNLHTQSFRSSPDRRPVSTAYAQAIEGTDTLFYENTSGEGQTLLGTIYNLGGVTGTVVFKKQRPGDPTPWVNRSRTFGSTIASQINGFNVEPDDKLYVTAINGPFNVYSVLESI